MLITTKRLSKLALVCLPITTFQFGCTQVALQPQIIEQKPLYSGFEATYLSHHQHKFSLAVPVELNATTQVKPLIPPNHESSTSGVFHKSDEPLDNPVDEILDFQSKVDALQVKINLLQAENVKIKQSLKQRRTRRLVYSLIKPNKLEQAEQPTSNGAAYASKEFIQLKTNVRHSSHRMNALLDKLDQSLLDQSSTYAMKVNPTNGVQPQIVTNDEKLPAPLYSVVYVMETREEWLKTWDLLHKKNIQDKWKGINKKTGIYFVYVGAYNGKFYASRRQAQLTQVLGLKPNIFQKNDMQNATRMIEHLKLSQAINSTVVKS